MQCMSVDLPEPDGPMMAVNCCLRNLIEIDLSASTAVSPVP